MVILNKTLDTPSAGLFTESRWSPCCAATATSLSFHCVSTARRSAFWIFVERRHGVTARLRVSL